MSFDQLGLSPKVLAAVQAAGFDTPTPIQEQAIPVVLQGGDVMGLAQTGTGKTASFTLPILNRLEKGRARTRMPRTLILEPTRELAAQVHESFELVGANHKLTIALLIGGVSFADQDRKLAKGADVLIATPGRLLDHFERGKLMMNGVEVLVVDEADRMLDMGFIPDIERICKLLPKSRQTLFFSATMPPEIQRITKAFLNNPTQIEVAARSQAASTITQGWVAVPSDPKGKRDALRRILTTQPVKNAIVFCNRKRDVALLEKSFERHKLSGRALHGDMNQHARLETLQMFRDGEITYLIASDVAARGLDIPEVSHVFNFDIPDAPEDYIHRIGRTGRAGKEGHAIGLVARSDRSKISAIEQLIGSSLPWLEGEPAETSDDDTPERRGRGRGRGAKPARRGREPKRDDSKRGEDKRGEGKPDDRKRDDRKPDDGDREVSEKTGTPDEKAKPRRTATTDKQPDSRRKSDRGKEVLGLGDHVPAFLMKPLRKDG